MFEYYKSKTEKKQMILLLYLIILLSPVIIPAQTKAVTSNGTNVILHKDGTWEIDEGNTSIDCTTLVKSIKTSEAEGLISKGAIEIENSKGNKASISLTSLRNVVAITVFVEGVGACISKGDDVLIYFEDESYLTLKYNTSEMNCESKFIFFLGKTFGNEIALNQLSEKRISSLGFKANKKNSIFAISETDAINLKAIINCIKP